MNGPQRHGATEKYGLTRHIIQCAIAVHRALGPGLLEKAYERALCIEFDDEGLQYECQKYVAAYYKGRLVGEYLIDLIVEDLVVVEIKSVERTAPVFAAQILNYMRVSQQRLGLLLNFNSHLMKNGIDRFVL
jgi:GxxExxY protein